MKISKKVAERDREREVTKAEVAMKRNSISHKRKKRQNHIRRERERQRNIPQIVERERESDRLVVIVVDVPFSSYTYIALLNF